MLLVQSMSSLSMHGMLSREPGTRKHETVPQ